jgi:hypothetical protein
MYNEIEDIKLNFKRQLELEKTTALIENSKVRSGAGQKY